MEQTELSMVNALLESIEETAIQEIDLTHPDVSLALRIWEGHSVTIQTRGWWFNKECFQLVIDARTGEVFLPDGVLELDSADPRFVKRGRRLYNLEDHTYNFTTDSITEEELFMSLIMEWDLTELPPIIYRNILLRSKIEMVVERNNDAVKVQAFTDDLNTVAFQCKKTNARYSNPNRELVNNAGMLLINQPQRYGYTQSYRYK